MPLLLGAGHCGIRSADGCICPARDPWQVLKAGVTTLNGRILVPPSPPAAISVERKCSGAAGALGSGAAAAAVSRGRTIQPG